MKKKIHNILLMETIFLCQYVIFYHHTYFLESAHHMKLKLFILTNHVLHISILYPFQFSSQFSLFPFVFLSSLIFTFICGKGSDPTKTVQQHLLNFERKEATFFCTELPIAVAVYPISVLLNMFSQAAFIFREPQAKSQQVSRKG